MIIINLDNILKERNITLTHLSKIVDITIANLSNLKTQKAKAIRFSTLYKIYTALNCQTGDILEYKE